VQCCYGEFAALRNVIFFFAGSEECDLTVKTCELAICRFVENRVNITGTLLK
jgi:hypothetical protein